MDETRTIRFVTPAFIFLGSMCFGAWQTFHGFVDAAKTLTPASATTIAAAVVAAMFPIGFILTGISTIALRAGFRFCGQHPYQIRLSEEGWKKVWSALKLPETMEKSWSNKVCAGVMFDNEILEKETHASAVRLWSAFNIAINSCTALLAAVFVGHCFAGFRLTCTWGFSTTLLFVLFATSAVSTWREHMDLLEMQCHRPVEKKGE